jgi:S1-C subfamily serine protease
MKNILAKYVQFDRSLKVHSLLAFLTVGTFAVSTMLPWMAVARGEAESIEANGVLTLATAQQAAAKITVRVRVGQGGGSGVLLAKKGGTYLVLTNAHVVQGQAGVSITTPDGLVHGARRVQNAQVGDFDLALLEFNSARAYDLAKLDNFKDPKKEARLREGYPVFTAGFSYNTDGLRLVEGKITQLPQEAFKNGTQVGYVTQGDLIQGMSGGPVLAINGDLVGINSTLARPVIDNYVYADGSKAPDDKVAEYRQANWSVPMYNLLTRLNPDVLYSYQQLPKLHRSVTPTGYMAELDRKARAVTVRIEKSNGANGSGVIVAKDGNSYYVLTNEHVVTKEVKGSGGSKNFVVNVKVTTADQRSYEVVVSDIKQAVGTDLAIMKFTSTQTYPVAILGSYSPSRGSRVFPGGWPAPQKINSQQWQWQLNPGRIHSPEQGVLQAQDKLSFSDGYDLIYTSLTYGGMSGGPIFDAAGQVIGIHGKAEGDGGTGTILGHSLGISIKTFLGLAERWGIGGRSLVVMTQAAVALQPEQEKSVDLVALNIPTPSSLSEKHP